MCKRIKLWRINAYAHACVFADMYGCVCTLVCAKPLSPQMRMQRQRVCVYLLTNIYIYIYIYIYSSTSVCLYICAFVFFDLDMCQQCKETRRHICTAQDMAGRGCHVIGRGWRKLATRMWLQRSCRRGLTMFEINTTVVERLQPRGSSCFPVIFHLSICPEMSQAMWNTSFFGVFPGRSLRTSVYCQQKSAEITHFQRRSVLHWWLGTCFRCGTCDTPVGGSLTVTETGWSMSWYVKVSFTSCWLLYMAGSLGQQGHGSRWPASLHEHWNDIPEKCCDVHIRCRDPWFMLWKMAWLNCSLHLRTFPCKRHHIFEPNLHAASLGTKTVFGAAPCDSCRCGLPRFDGVYHFLENLRASHGFINDERVWHPNYRMVHVYEYAGSWWTVHNASKTRSSKTLGALISSYLVHVLVIFCRGSDEKKTEDGKYHRMACADAYVSSHHPGNYWRTVKRMME